MRGTALNPGNSRRTKITEAILEKHGRTPGCPASMRETGRAHEEHCRARIEKALVSSGEAFDLGQALPEKSERKRKVKSEERPK